MSATSYAALLAELEKIVATLQSDNCDIDSMVSLTRRATEIITELRKRLTTTDTELREVLATLSQSDRPA